MARSAEQEQQQEEQEQEEEEELPNRRIRLISSSIGCAAWASSVSSRTGSSGET
jgi:hypothetical protein